MYIHIDRKIIAIKTKYSIAGWEEGWGLGGWVKTKKLRSTNCQ